MVVWQCQISLKAVSKNYNNITTNNETYNNDANNKYPIEKTHEIFEREHEGKRENTFPCKREQTSINERTDSPICENLMRGIPYRRGLDMGKNGYKSILLQTGNPISYHVYKCIEKNFTNVYKKG